MLGNVNQRWQDEEAPWIKRHGLSIVLIAFLLVQSLVFHFTRLPEWVSEQQAHQESTALWPAYWLHYSSEWFVSVLADTYGALLLVLLTKWFYEKGSGEGKDPPEDRGGQGEGDEGSDRTREDSDESQPANA